MLSIDKGINCGTPAEARGSTRKERPLQCTHKRLEQVIQGVYYPHALSCSSGPWPTEAVEAQHHGQRRTSGEWKNTTHLKGVRLMAAGPLKAGSGEKSTQLPVVQSSEPIVLPWRETPELNPEPLDLGTGKPGTELARRVPTSFPSGDAAQLARLATLELAPLWRDKRLCRRTSRA